MISMKYVELVRETREMQKAYFRTRDKGVLKKSKQLEKQLDMETEAILSGQSTLFN